MFRVGLIAVRARREKRPGLTSNLASRALISPAEDAGRPVLAAANKPAAREWSLTHALQRRDSA